MSAHNSDGAWELPHEFRQMQDDRAALHARTHRAGRGAAAARRLRAAGRRAQAAAGRSEEARLLERGVAGRMGRRRAQSARSGGRRRRVLAVQDGTLHSGVPCLRLGSAERDLPRPQGPDREIRRADDAARRQDVRRDLGGERRLRSRPRDQDARREEGRPLHPQRHQDLDLGCRAVGLGARVRAHRPEQGPRRRHLVHRREEVQGLQLQADPGDPLVLPLRDQLRGLRSAGGKPPRRRGRGLQARRDLADPRAHSLCGGGDRRRAGGARSSRSTGPSSARPSARSSPTSRRSSG